MINKKIIIFNNKSSIEQIDMIIRDTPKKCNLFKYDKDLGYFMQYKNAGWDIIDFSVFVLNLKDSNDFKMLYNLIVDNIYNVFYEIIPKIKTSTHEYKNYFVMYEGKIDSIVNSILYNDEKSKDLFTMIANLLVRISSSHSFSNGNKRTALISISYILKFFGLYLKFSSDYNKNNKEIKMDNYVEYWEKFMIDLVKKSEDNSDSIVEEVKDILIKNTWLSL